MNFTTQDFTTTPVQVTIYRASENDNAGDTLRHILEAMRKTKANICTLGTNGEVSEEAIHDCTITLFGKATTHFTYLNLVIRHGEYQELFQTSPGHTTMAKHFILMTGTPVRVPQCCITASYRRGVEHSYRPCWQKVILRRAPTLGWLLLCLSTRNPDTFDFA